MPAHEADETDPSLLSYDEWLRFFFEQPVVKQADEVVPAFDRVITPIDFRRPEQMVVYLCRMCCDFGDLARRYDWRQLDQGAWGALMLPGWTADALFGRETDQSIRIACIDTMYRPFAEVLALAPNDAAIENSMFMWWDIVGEAFWSKQGIYDQGLRYVAGTEARQTQDAMLHTLKRILHLPERRCQRSALHGLGHLHHPDGAPIVEAWLKGHRSELDEEGIRWVEQCRDGMVM